MTRGIPSYTTIGLTLLLFGLAACAGDGSTGPGATVSDAEIETGIATDAGDAVATSVDLMNDDESAAGASGSVVVAPGVSASVGASATTVACGGPDGDGWYTCARTTWRGLDVTREVRFWAGGSLAPAWDPAATDSVNARVAVTGSFHPAADPAKTVWVNRADTATMVVDRSGAPVLHVWNRVGTRADSATYTAPAGTRTFHYTAYDTASAVAFAMPRSEHPWPLSGTVVHAITTLFTATSGTRDFSRTVMRRAAVTFNGTQTVPLQVGALTCVLDLGTHEVGQCR